MLDKLSRTTHWHLTGNNKRIIGFRSLNGRSNLSGFVFRSFWSFRSFCFFTTTLHQFFCTNAFFCRLFQLKLLLILCFLLSRSCDISQDMCYMLKHLCLCGLHTCMTIQRSCPNKIEHNGNCRCSNRAQHRLADMESITILTRTQWHHLRLLFFFHQLLQRKC